MSSFSFMSGVSPYMIKVGTTSIVIIRPIDHAEAVIYFTDLDGNALEIPLDLEIHSFEYKNKDTVNECVVEKDIKITQADSCALYFKLQMTNSYNIYHGEYIVLEGGKSVNGRLYEIGDLFEYPPSQEEFVEYNASKFSVLIRASITENSDVAKVSSLTGIEVGKMVEGQGIPEYTWIIAIDYDDLQIQLSQCASDTLCNITLHINTMSPDDEDFIC